MRVTKMALISALVSLTACQSATRQTPAQVAAQSSDQQFLSGQKSGRAAADLFIRLGKFTAVPPTRDGFSIKYVPYATDTIKLSLKLGKGPGSPVLNSDGKSIADTLIPITDTMREAGILRHRIEDLPVDIPLYVQLEATITGKTAARLEQQIIIDSKAKAGGDANLRLSLQGVDTYVDTLSLSKQNPDIPSDPAIPPPAEKEAEIATSVSVTEDEHRPGRFIVNLGGILAPETRQPVEVSASDIVLVEDEATKGFKFSDLGKTVLPIDLILLIDNTSSMRDEINGVKESLANFIKDLKEKNLDVNVGAVAFSDGLFNPAEIKPETDPAAKTVYSFEYPVSFSTEAGATKILNYISNLSLSDGGLLPEGLLDSLWWTLRNGAGTSHSGETRSDFGWREQAQKIFIVITDAMVWEAGGNEISSRSSLTTAGLAKTLREQNTVVHVVSSALELHDFRNNLNSIGDPRALAEALDTSNLEGTSSPGTGGIWKLLPLNGRVSLLDLNLQSLLAKSVKLEFTSQKRALDAKNEQAHTLRIVVEKAEAALDAEKRVTKTY